LEIPSSLILKQFVRKVSIYLNANIVNGINLIEILYPYKLLSVVKLDIYRIIDNKTSGIN